MAYASPLAWYVSYGNGSSTGYYAVTVRPQNTAVAAGVIRRQFTAPAVGSERCFVCTTAGTTANTTDATWSITKGAKTTDSGAVWFECSGEPGVNGDTANCPVWTVSSTPPLGRIIYVVSNGSLQICTTSGAGGVGSIPGGFSTTAGVTTADASATWTSLGLASNFGTWAAPHARIGNAFGASWAGAGSTVYVADNSAETAAATVAISVVTNATSATAILCVDHTASFPLGSANLTTGASVSGTSTHGITINNSAMGVSYFRGVTFNPSSTMQIGNTSNGKITLDACAISMTGAFATWLGENGNNGCDVTLINTPFTFSNSGATLLLVTGRHVWRDTASAIGGTAPTNLIGGSSLSQGVCNMLVEGVDLSGLTGTFFNGTTTVYAGYILIKNCKLNSGLTVASNLSLISTAYVAVNNSDSGATNYRNEMHSAYGDQTVSTSVYRASGFAIEGTSLSGQVITTANSLWLQPFEHMPVFIRNATTGANVTVTMYGASQTAALPNNDDFWFEVEYMASVATPISTRATGTKANVLASGSALTADTSDWTGGAAAYQTAHAYGAGAGVYIKAGNASPQQVWFVASHTGTGTSGSSTTIFNGQSDGAQVTDNAGANQIVWQALTRWSMTIQLDTTHNPQPALAGLLSIYPKFAKASTTFFLDQLPDPLPVLS